MSKNNAEETPVHLTDKIYIKSNPKPEGFQYKPPEGQPTHTAADYAKEIEKKLKL